MTDDPFSFCLNTSTIRGQTLSLIEEIEIVAAAGYDGIEPWIRELDAFVESGGSLESLGQRIADLGLMVPNVIGFFEWAVDDQDRRDAGLNEAQRNMEMCLQLGCSQLAAPPFGVTEVRIDLDRLCERYRALLEIGAVTGVTPVLEFWGIAKTLGALGEAVHVAVATGHRDARVLADVYHMYKGGSPHNGLHLLGPETLGLVHINDYPSDPPLDTITDADRVLPGDGAAPLARILGDLEHVGYRGMLSLELFNEEIWQRDALTVAKEGLDKMQRVVAARKVG
jgi:sugar phosphate isomerase/epimerase